MSQFIFIGVVSVLVGIIVSRLLAEKALAMLSQKEKADLIDEFANIRKYGQIPIIIALAIYMVIELYGIELADKAIVALLILFLLNLVVSQLIIIRKLTSMNLPESYVKKYKLSRYIYNLGFGICGLSILAKILEV